MVEICLEPFSQTMEFAVYLAQGGKQKCALREI